MRASIAEIVHLYPVLGLPKMAEADELSMRWELIHRGRCQVSVCEIGLGRRSDGRRAWRRKLVSYHKTRPRTSRKGVYGDGIVDGAMTRS